MDEDLPSTFTLWSPVFPRPDECRFDVRPADFVGLHQGTSELMGGFLKVLGVDARPKTWTIQSFCSPYFAGAQPGESHLDKYPRAWRVAVRLADGSPEHALPFFGPHPSDALDATWTETEGEWKWIGMDCVVIADFAERRWGEGLSGVRSDPAFASCRGFEELKAAPGFVQARFDLGNLQFPMDSPKVDEFVSACRRRFASVNWATSLRMSLD